MRYGSPLSISGSYEHLQATVEKGQVDFGTMTDFADFATRTSSISARKRDPPPAPVFFSRPGTPKPRSRANGGWGKRPETGGAGGVSPLADFADSADFAGGR